MSMVTIAHAKAMCQVQFATSSKTSAWQGSGKQKQIRSRPRSSFTASAFNSGLSSRIFRYLRITCSLVPSLPIMKGFPHFDGLPTKTASAGASPGNRVLWFQTLGISRLQSFLFYCSSLQLLAHTSTRNYRSALAPRLSASCGGECVSTALWREWNIS